MMDWAEKEALDLTGPCTCHEGYRSRKLTDPSCRFCDDGGDTRDALRKARADGMREAAELLGTLTYGSYAKELYDRAAEIEKGNT